MEGYASLFGEIDSARDMVLPGAFRDTLALRGLRRIPMLFQHDPAEPIGIWLDLVEDARGLYVRGRLIPDVARAREVLALVRAGALDGLSIGFRTASARVDPKTRVRKVAAVDLWEISIVTFPLLAGARIAVPRPTSAKGGIRFSGPPYALPPRTASAPRPTPARSAAEAAWRQLLARGSSGATAPRVTLSPCGRGCPSELQRARAGEGLLRSSAGARTPHPASRLTALSHPLPQGEREGLRRPAPPLLKYRPDQPRVPAGNPDGGQWTDGAATRPSEAHTSAPGDDTNVGSQSDAEFSPDKPGWHRYPVGPNQVCRPQLQCTPKEASYYLARFSLPGRSPEAPVEHNSQNSVFVGDAYVGEVVTTITDDGLTIRNRTLEGHWFFDGVVVRRIWQAEDGGWYVTTEGYGNNVVPGLNIINELAGPEVFNDLDRQMRDAIERDRAKGNLHRVRLLRDVAGAARRPRGVGEKHHGG